MRAVVGRDRMTWYVVDQSGITNGGVKSLSSRAFGGNQNQPALKSFNLRRCFVFGYFVHSHCTQNRFGL